MRHFYLGFLICALLGLFSCIFLILGILNMDKILLGVGLLCIIATWLAYKEFDVVFHFRQRD